MVNKMFKINIIKRDNEVKSMDEIQLGKKTTNKTSHIMMIIGERSSEKRIDRDHQSYCKLTLHKGQSGYVDDRRNY